MSNKPKLVPEPKEPIYCGNCCPLHKAAPALLKSLERFKEWADNWADVTNNAAQFRATDQYREMAAAIAAATEAEAMKGPRPSCPVHGIVSQGAKHTAGLGYCDNCVTSPTAAIRFCALHAQAPAGYELAKLIVNGYQYPAILVELARSIVAGVEEA